MEQYSCSIRTYFKYNKRFMVTAGIWPYQSPCAARIIRLIWIMQHVSIMTPEIIKLIEVRNATDLVLECIPSLCYNILIGVLYINFMYHQPKIKEILEKIHKNWIKISEESEIEILRRYSDFGITIDLLYIVSIYLTMIIFCLFPLTPYLLDYFNPLNETRSRFPLYRVQFYVDDEKYYWTILMHAYATTIIGIMPILIADLFLANCVQHACGMMIILGKRLTNTMNTASVTNKLDDSMYNDVKDCSILYAEILEFVKDINYVFRTAFGISLVILVSLTSMTGVVVLVKWGIWNDVIRFTLFTLAEAFHMFCYNYHSQDVINHNDQVYRSMLVHVIHRVNSRWYESSYRTRILIQMMFLQNCRPCLIKCLIFPLTMENYTSIMKTTFSYFTVVKSSRSQ